MRSERHWARQFIGIPFVANGRDRSGCDCWGLAVIVYLARRGVVLPGYDGVLGDMSTMDLVRVSRAVQSESKKWIPVDAPVEMDLLLFRDMAASWHIGIALDGRSMLHTHREIGESVIEEYTGLHYRNKLEGVYRYAG